jgi:stress response protein YsnF
MKKEIEAGDIVVVIMTNAQLRGIGLDFTTNMGQEFKVLAVSTDKQEIQLDWGWTTIKAFRLVNKNKWSIYNNTTKNVIRFTPKFNSPDGVYTAVIKNSDEMHNVIKPDEDLLKKYKDVQRGLLIDIEHYKIMIASKDRDISTMHNVISADKDLVKKYKDVQRVLLTDIEHYKSVCASKDKDINTLYNKLLAEEKENLKLRKTTQPKHLISKGKNNYHADNTARELIDRNAELERVLKLVHYDLLLRAEEDSDGVKVVDVGSSVWASLKGAIGLA